MGPPQTGWWRNRVGIPGEQGAGMVSGEKALLGRATWPKAPSGVD